VSALDHPFGIEFLQFSKGNDAITHIDLWRKESVAAIIPSTITTRRGQTWVCWHLSVKASGMSTNWSPTPPGWFHSHNVA